MSSRRTALLAAGLAVVLAAPVAEAQQHHDHGQQAALAPYASEFLTAHDFRFGRLIALAEAFPEDVYTWRPAEGVRSVSEALLHMAAGTYYLFSFAGVQPPEDIEVQGLEHATTDKAEVIAHLRRAQQFARDAVTAGSQDPEAQVGWFGDARITHRDLLLRITGHAGEHLGQLIAYARMNGVTPPWSR